MNVVDNHLIHRSSLVLGECPSRQARRDDGLSTYALIDFDSGHIFPENAALTECRLKPRQPGYEHPYDTAQGEPDYNPFAWDIGNMGAYICGITQASSKAIVF